MHPNISFSHQQGRNYRKFQILIKSTAVYLETTAFFRFFQNLKSILHTSTKKVFHPLFCQKSV